MKHIKLFVILTLLAFSGRAAAQQKPPTVRDVMEMIEDEYDIKFVYESGLDVDVVCPGAKAAPDDIDRVLRKAFRGSGIKWKRDGRYVVLTKALPENIILEPETVRDTLDEARIISERLRRTRTQTGLKHLEGRDFRKGYATFSSPDIVKSLHSYTGVQSGTEMFSGLYVHGGTGRDNLYLLDGVPLYQVNHVAGIFSSFNTDVVGKVDFYKSGFPARFGGRLSSVVDVSVNEGDFNKFHGSFSIGLLDARLQFEGPIVKGRTSFNVSMRRSWIDGVATPYFKFANMSPGSIGSYSYSFHDINAKIVHKFSKGNKLSLNFFTGRDALGAKGDVPAGFQLAGENRFHSGNNRFDVAMKWGHILASLNWDMRINEILDLKAILYYTRQKSHVDYLEKIYAWDSGAGDNHFVTENDTFLALDDISAKVDLVCTPHKDHCIRFGGQYLYHLYGPERYYSLTRQPENGVGEQKEDIYSRRYGAHETSLYIDDEIHILDWLDLTAGLRYTMFASDGNIWNGLEPRLAVNVRFSKDMAFKASYVEMNQYSHGIATTSVDMPMNFWMPSTKKMEPMHSRQLAAEFIMNLPYGFHVELGGFYRTLDNISEYAGTSHLFPNIARWETDFVEGQGLAYGAEAMLGWSWKKMDVNLNYTLSWNMRKFEDFYPEWYYDRNDSRHKVNVDFAYRINEKVSLCAAWNYHSGFRAACFSSQRGEAAGMDHFAYRFYAGPNNLKLPDYHRLDLGADFRRITKRGNESIWNVSIYNVYCRMNPFMFVEYMDAKEDDPRGKVYSIFPILPSFSYTFKF